MTELYIPSAVHFALEIVLKAEVGFLSLPH